MDLAFYRPPKHARDEPPGRLAFYTACTSSLSEYRREVTFPIDSHLLLIRERVLAKHWRMLNGINNADGSESDDLRLVPFVPTTTPIVCHLYRTSMGNEQIAETS